VYLPFGATSRFSGSPPGRGQNFDLKTVPESLASGATMIMAFVARVYFGTFRTMWGLFFVCAHFARVWHMCTLTPSHCTPPSPHSCLCLSSPLLAHPRNVCSCWPASPPSFVPLSLCPLFQYGETALMKASSNGHAKVVELLLAAKADTNLKGPMSLPSTPQRDIEDERPPSPNACTCIPTLTKGPHLPSRLWA